MLALSIRQPHIFAMLSGQKVNEYRQWKVPTKIRGWIALHAGLKIEQDACDAYDNVPMELPVGGILGLGWIADSKTWTEGHVVIKFAQIVELPNPIRCKGTLGFFPVTGDVLENINRQAKRMKLERWEL